MPERGAAPLDDVMLAMDVVDTMRHRQELVELELRTGERDEEMLDRLRKIYAAQGIDVPDRILRDGVAALREERFVYRPPAPSAATRWARIYVHRGRWLRRAALLAVVLVAAAAIWDASVRAPRRGLEADLNAARTAIHAVAEAPEAEARADVLHEAATTALERGDGADARDALASLRALQATLERAYELRIALEPDTGVWRVPDVNTGARNYYIVVEAVDARGRPVSVPIVSEETGEVREVERWGLRVDEATFERVRDDKLDDGILQERRFGEKRAGALEPEYRFPTTGGAITEW
jgi:hypothetical protein